MHFRWWTILIWTSLEGLLQVNVPLSLFLEPLTELKSQHLKTP